MAKNIVTTRLFRNLVKGSEHCISRHSYRSCSSSACNQTCRSWAVHKYGGSMQMAVDGRIPVITDPNDVLIKVSAASVNPIDIKMTGGYGRKLIHTMRQMDGMACSVKELPLTPGRDCSGTVVATGSNVTNYRPGDEVWSAVAAHRPGTHADYVLTAASAVSRKPSSLSHVDAASFPYVACTVWSALCTMGGLHPRNTPMKRVLILAGSGGIGNFAIQLMKAWGANVTVLCSTSAIDTVASMGPDCIVNYESDHVETELKKYEGFDVILHNVGSGKYAQAINVLKSWNNSQYISIDTPMLSSTDSLGLIAGSATACSILGVKTLQGLMEGKYYKWAFFQPHGKALSTVADLIDKHQISPNVERVYAFDELPLAYERVTGGHLLGKIVIDVAGTS
ncbi:PREDICTED: reticulon-4-interacting protein 1 homolog, mitochondrial-like [Priapulus caudatus]|uniref:Reticulon-4-interacting protein 1 homolog, mitochondrial-like n=1 Tax=Priapulus caudatus TaxID=37621 RepID=A0ABM1EM72_PRICU|nr:PREDICTED: reticulon-4-interacting protein 1 homolog, mitochondrial-like [Priapulus caudatus]